MDLALLYREIELRIRKVDFSAVWKGFYPLRFAVYTDEQCYFDGNYIEKTDAFCANTAIQWGDEYIAIWNITENPEDMDALAASIIHEMFHAFQRTSGERRFPDEREALFQYRYFADNLSTKRAEAECMRAILEANDLDAYSELLSLRKKRAEDYPYEYEYEARVEQIEGTANFVELSALAQLDEEKGNLAWKRLLDRLALPESYFPIRRICYETGAAMIACIKRCSSIDCEGFRELPFSCEVLAGVNGGAAANDAEMEECLDRYLDETHRMIVSAVEKNDCVLKGEYPLISVNIWDARCEGRYATSNRLLIYADGEEQKVIYGDFVVEVDTGYNVLSVFRQ